MSEAARLLVDHVDIWSGAVERKNGAGRGNAEKLSLYGIEKLRSLILDLAIRGNLVPQDPNDEPAAELLKRANKAMLEGVARKKMRLPKGLKFDPSKLKALPHGWEWTRLIDIAQINPRNEADDDIEASFVPMPLISDRVDGAHEAEIRQWGDIRSGYTHFGDGDVALAKITPCFENEKAAIFSNLKNGIGAGTTELHVARPLLPDFDRRYLLLCLKTPQYLTNGEANMTGTAGQKRVPRSYFELTPFPLPPLAEQKRIVTKVDELMALCDALEKETREAKTAHEKLVRELLATLVDIQNADGLVENWSRVEEHFDTLFNTEESIDVLKQSVLELAVRGRLSHSSKTSDKARSYDRVVPQPSQIPFSIPRHWRWARLSMIGQMTGGGTPSKSNSKLWEGDIPWVSPKDMKRDVLSDAQLHISQAAIEQSSARLIKPESIMFVVRGMILAHSFPVAINAVPVAINQDMKAIELHDPESVDYFLFALQALKSEMLAKVSRSGHGTCRLESDHYNNFWIPIPPKSEQQLLLQIVHKLDAVCNDLKASFRESEIAAAQIASLAISSAIGVE